LQMWADCHGFGFISSPWQNPSNFGSGTYFRVWPSPFDRGFRCECHRPENWCLWVPPQACSSHKSRRTSRGVWFSRSPKCLRRGLSQRLVWNELPAPAWPGKRRKPKRTPRPDSDARLPVLRFNRTQKVRGTMRRRVPYKKSRLQLSGGAGRLPRVSQ